MQMTEPLVRDREKASGAKVRTTQPHRKSLDRWDGVLVLTLALAVGGVFSGVAGHEFLLYDDDVYVTSNTVVRQGLTWDSVRWAFETNRAANWHPITWLSHMVDTELYGLQPRGHHLSNLGLHVVNVCLIFALLRWTTGRRWPSVLAAALFGLHPLRVESVAWVAERKELLSVFFGLLTIAAYVWYTHRPKAWWRYIAALVLFTFALMSKPMLVTLPFVLLLLDWWPLNRYRLEDRPPPKFAPLAIRLVIEKLPLFILSAASSYITYTVQRSGGAVSQLDALPLHIRIENAFVGCMKYLERTFWPTELSFLYPHPLTSLPSGQVAMGAGLLIAISVVAVLIARRMPYVPVGWFWFVGALVPTLGFVQVGLQATADRYTYWPEIGLTILIAWSLAEVATRLRLLPVFRVAACVTILGGLSIATWRQVTVWHDTLTLAEHALEIDSHNSIAMTVTAQSFSAQGRTAEAISMYREAIATDTPLAKAHGPETKTLLAAALLSSGEVAEAALLAAEAVAEKPQLAMSRLTLGTALFEQGHFEEARSQLEAAVRLDPMLPAAHANLANVLIELGDFPEAIDHGRQAVALSYELVAAHYNLGRALAAVGDFPSAIAHFQAGLQDGPQWPLVARQLAWIRATCPMPQYRDADEALRLAEEADRQTRHQVPQFLDTLAAAYAEAQAWPQAVDAAELAIRLAIEQDQTDQLPLMRQRLEHYRARRPWREPPVQ